VSHSQQRAGVGRVGVAASYNVQHIGHVADPGFSPYLGEGVTPRPKFCTPLVLQKGSAQAKKRKKIMHMLCVPSPTFFQLWGPLPPESGWGADICILLPPSDRGRRRLKIRSDANFSYGICGFFAKTAVIFGGLAFSPLRAEHSGHLLIGHKRHLPI